MSDDIAVNSVRLCIIVNLLCFETGRFVDLERVEAGIKKPNTIP